MKNFPVKVTVRRNEKKDGRKDERYEWMKEIWKERKEKGMKIERENKKKRMKGEVLIVAKALDGQRYPLPLCEYVGVRWLEGQRPRRGR